MSVVLLLIAITVVIGEIAFIRWAINLVPSKNEYSSLIKFAVGGFSVWLTGGMALGICIISLFGSVCLFFRD